MKIAYCSDLHLEFSPIDVEILKSDADVLVLAGDIMLFEMLKDHIINHKNTITGRERFYLVEFLEYLNINYEHVIWIPGNHEYYRGDYSDYKEIKNLLGRYKNIHLINNEVIDVGIRIYGGTCWTDMASDPLMYAQCRRILNDFRMIHVNDKILNFQQWLTWHQEFLSNFEATDVVISHHSPSYKTTSQEFVGDIANPLYCSNLEHLMRGVKYWIHGHQHGAERIKVNGCQVLNNARGYPGQECYSNFKLEFIDVV